MNPNDSAGSTSKKPGAASKKNAWFLGSMIALVVVLGIFHQPVLPAPDSWQGRANRWLFDALGAGDVLDAQYAAQTPLDISKPLPPVVLYGAAWCGACTLAKDWLNEKKIPFAYCDIDHKAPCVDSFRQTGMAHSIPVTVIGNTAVVGFDPDEFLALLQP
jgi:glutaredoxin